MRFTDFKETLLNKWKGISLGIPINPNLKRLKSVLGTWEPNEALLFAGATGSGKSRYIFKHAVIDSLRYVSKHPKAKVRVLWLSLELSELEMVIMLCQHLFKEKLEKLYTRDFILNKFQKTEPDKEFFDDLEKIKPSIEYFFSHVTIVTEIRTVKKWMEYCTKILNDLGTVVDGKYVKKDPNLLVIAVVDTINTFTPEPNQTKLVTISDYSENHMKKTLRNFYGVSLISIQQLDKQSQTSQFSNTGKRVAEKHRVSSENLKDSKSTIDDHSMGIAIFSPHRFHIEHWEGYDIAPFKYSINFLHILKNNFGEMVDPIAIYTNPMTLEYEEIPDPKSEKTLYDAFMKKHKLTSEGVNLLSSPAKLQFQQLFNKEENGTIELE